MKKFAVSSLLCFLTIIGYAETGTITISAGDRTLKASAPKDSMACDISTNTIVSQDKEQHGKPCDVTTIQAINHAELDKSVDDLPNYRPSPELSQYQTKQTSWIYDTYQDDWSEKKHKIAILPSTDNNVILAVGYNQSDKKKNNPVVSFYFNWEVDRNYVVHAPLCYGECKFDLKADDNIYPNIAMIRQGASQSVFSKYAKTTVNRIKDATVIKIRVQLMGGNLQTYTFNTSQPLDFKRL